MQGESKHGCTLYEHSKKPVVAIEQLKKMWGYDSQIQSNTEMYGNKIICRIPSLNPDYLINKKHRLEHEKRIKDCIAVNQSLQDEIELASLLAGSAKGEELKRIKANIFKQLNEQNQIMSGQCTQKQLGWKNTTLETQQNLLIEELKDLLVVGQNYQNLLLRVKKITYRQEVNKEKTELEMKMEEILKDIIDKVDDIISSGSDGNDILKKVTISRLESMLFFLDEISNSDEKYKRFLAQCKVTQEVSFNDSYLESNSRNYDNIMSGLLESSPWLVLNKWGVKISCSRNATKQKESKSSSEGTNNRGNQDLDIGGDHDDDDAIELSGDSHKLKNQTTFQESEFLTADEVIAKVEHNYKKTQRRRLTATDIGKMQLIKSKLSEPSYKSIVVALQTITGYQNILSSVYKILNLNEDWIKLDSRLQKQLLQLQQSIHQMNILIAGGNSSISIHETSSNNTKKSKPISSLVQRSNSTQINSNPTLERIILTNAQHMFTCQSAQLSILQIIKQIQSIKDSFYIPPKDKYSQSQNTEEEQTAITYEHLLIHGNDLKPLLARIDPSVFIKQEVPHISQAVVATPSMGMRNKPNKYLLRNSIKKPFKRENLENIHEYHQHQHLKDAIRRGNSRDQQNRSSSQRTRGVLTTETDQSEGASCRDRQSVRIDSSKKQSRNQIIRATSQKTENSKSENRSSINRLQSQRKYSDISSCSSSAQNREQHSWSFSMKNRISNNETIDLRSYIDNCFDESGRNDDICNRTRDIDIEAAANSIALRNIFVEDWQKIDVDEVIQEMKGKKGTEGFQKQDYINAIREKRKESINGSYGNIEVTDALKERSKNTLGVQNADIGKDGKTKSRSASIAQKQAQNLLVGKENRSEEAAIILPITPKSVSNSRTRRVKSFGSCFGSNSTQKQEKSIQNSQQNNSLQIQEIHIAAQDSGEKQLKTTNASVIAVSGPKFKQRKLHLYQPLQVLSPPHPSSLVPKGSFDSLQGYADPLSTFSQKHSDLKVSFDRKSMKTTQESNFMSKMNGPVSSKGNSAAFSFYAANTNVFKNNNNNTKTSFQDKTLQTIDMNTENDMYYYNQDDAEMTIAKKLQDENILVLKNIQVSIERQVEGEDLNTCNNHESQRNNNQGCDGSVDNPNVSVEKEEKPKLRGVQVSTDKSVKIPQSSKIPSSDHATQRSHQTEDSEELNLEQKRLEQEKLEEQKEEQRLNLRNQIVQKYLALKRPRYIMLGTSGVAVKGTAEEINKIQLNTEFAQKLSRQAENKKNRDKLKKHISEIGRQGEVSNIEILSGPPKKYQFEVSSIQHDFNDKLISKMIKH